jgi:hypothetical protein
MHIKSQAFELTTRNNTNIWMNKFCNVNIGSPPQIVIGCTGVEPCNINSEYVIKPHAGDSTIHDSSNIDANN